MSIVLGLLDTPLYCAERLGYLLCQNGEGRISDSYFSGLSHETPDQFKKHKKNKEGNVDMS